MSHLQNLNDRQKEAVLHTTGPLLIIAGAGAGKTKTLTHRILHLIKEGVSPSSILAITFTNKAAKEMRERVEHLLASDPDINRPVSSNERPFVSTFHSLGVHILREQSRLLDLSRHFSIFDRGDSLRSIKEAMAVAGIDPKAFEPGKILSVISREKGNMVGQEEFAERNERNPAAKMVSAVWREYEKHLKQEKALDFDDLLLKTALLLEKNAEVRVYYQNIWQYIHIDEYQDTNRVQYRIARLLAEKSRNICVVGDTDQCLLPDTKIKTSEGYKRIDGIAKGDRVFAANGDGGIHDFAATTIRKRRYAGDILTVKTKGGKILTLTPNHILFASLSLNPNIYYVYLMYRKDQGFRIGMVKGSRKPVADRDEIGLQVRCHQEKADRMWILRICEHKTEAQYSEIFFSSQYGIPMLVFHTAGRNMAMKQETVNRIFREIDTRTRAQKIFEDMHLSFDYPHYFPQGTIAGNGGRNRINVRLTMFSDRRKSIIKPWGMSRISINSGDPTMKKILEKNGIKTRKGKDTDWRVEIARVDYGETEKILETIQKLRSDVTIIKSAFLTKKKRMLFQPASNLHRTMRLASLQNGEIVEDEIISVEKKHYEGYVYDMDIPYVHNYLASDIVIHNCIYSWRGADIKNILDFEKDYPEAKVVLLEENYRSTQTILTVANRIIEKNKMRKEKRLFTKRGEGEKLSLFTGYDEADEARFVASKSKQLIENGVAPKEIAVLYRANFQSRALEEAFLGEMIPYQVLGTRFFDRREVKDVVSYLKAALNTESMNDFKRIINAPARGIGKVTLLKIVTGQENELPPKTREKIAVFRVLLSNIKETAEKEKPSQTIKFILKESGIEDHVKGEVDGEERLENIRELVTFATKYDIYPKAEGLEKFLTDVSLASDQDEIDREEKNAVKLMTVHASKGLEFEYVFITGLEEDLFPHAKDENRTSQSETEEERRLFYVALTRAKKKIYLSYTSFRTIFGEKRFNVPSEFVFDIDEEFIEKEEPLSGGGKIIYLD